MLGGRRGGVTGLLAWLSEPFSYPFMVRGLWASLIVGIVVPLLGTYVVLRGMAFFGDAMAHIVLPGVVVGVLAALIIGAISRRTRIREDTAIGVVFAGAFALGVAMLSLQRSYAVDLAHILFGNLLGVSNSDLRLMAVLSGIVLLTIGAFYKEFLVMSFDPTLAATLRLPVFILQNALLVLMALVIVVSLQTVGVALILAMLVTPGATAYLVTRRLPSMMAVASILGAASAICGLYLSFYWNFASGPAIVLVETAVFVVVFIMAPSRGWRRSSILEKRG